VSAVFGRSDSVLSENEVDFVTRKLRILPSRFSHRDQPRWVHVDLGLTGDSAGVACGYVSEFVKIKRDRAIETLPKITIDFTLRVNPPRGDEISFEKIRLLLYKLRDQGLDIRWVSFDSFQSRDSLQILRQKGFHTGLVSVDKDTHPYDVLKTAIYDGRVSAPRHDWALRELLSLERVPLKDKIDHPPNGSKDVADALCGVVYGLSLRRSIWIDHGITLFEIPAALREKVVKADASMKSGESSPEIEEEEEDVA
jgi:hypothetical protein